jgi:hypothetical protein
VNIQKQLSEKGVLEKIDGNEKLAVGDIIIAFNDTANEYARGRIESMNEGAAKSTGNINMKVVYTFNHTRILKN